MPDPQKISKYTIIQRIGRGGMGYVYKAHDPVLKRDVAIKTMLREVSDDEELRNRFLREAQSAGGLRHPNIVTIYDLGEDNDGCPFIAMEFLTGTDLEHLIKNKVELPIAKKLDIIIQTCYGLGFAHSNGIVHRDIKTANIRLLDNGEIKIMDFGIAKMTASHFTRTGMIMGTPHYMAPEQIRGEKVDGRADIFSLGVVLFELLTYRKPFPGDNPTTVLFKIIHENPESLVDGTFTPPPGLEQVVAMAIAKKPEERYQTCEDFAADLLQVLTLVQQSGESADGSAVAYPTPYSGRGTPTPFPSLRRTGGSSAFGTPPGTRSNLTLPSQERENQTQSSQGGTAVPPSNLTVPGRAATQVKQPTQATVAKPPVMNQAETAYAGAGVAPRTDLPEITLTPVPSPARKWILLATSGVLGVGVILIVALGFFRPKPPVIVQPVKPPIEIPVTPPPVKVENGWLALNIQPWAVIKEIKDAKGNFVTPPLTSTPCRMELPPGRYSITLVNKQYKPLILSATVEPGKTLSVKQSMEGFDYAKAVDSLGL